MSIRSSETTAMQKTTPRPRHTGPYLLAMLVGACLSCPALDARGQSAPSIVEVPATAPTTTSAPTTMPAGAPAATTSPAPTTAPTTAPVAEGPVFRNGQVLPSGQILLNFQNVPLREVLVYLSKATGLIVVGEPVLEGKVTVISRVPISLAEAVLLLDTVLRQKGYAAVYTGRNLKIVGLAQAAKENIPVQFGNDPAKLTVSDRMITQVIPIRFVDATKLRTDLTALLPATAVMSANQASNSLILTDTQANVRRILEIIASLDGQLGAEATVKVYKLEYADATTTAKLITDLFASNQSQQQNQPRFPFMFGRGGDRGGDRGSSSNSSSSSTSRQTKVTATADTRTNNLVVSASPEALTVIDGIVKELDSNPTAEEAVFIYPLKNAQAENVEAVLNNIFGSGTTSGRTSSTSSRGSTTSSRFGSSSSGSRFGSSSSGSRFGSSSSGSGFGSSSTGSRFGSSSTGSRFGGSTSGRSSYSLGAAGASAGDLAGQVFVVADVDTNSLLVRTASKNFDRVQAILAELDRPTRQVLIKVLLAEVTHEDTTDLGVEFSALNIGIGSSTTSIGTGFGVAAAAAGTTPGLVAKVVDADFTVTLRALATVGRLNVLSRPYILASDNQEATITVGNVVPFIRDSRITDTGQTINTIEYEDIGIILDVLPHINPEGLVIMDVAPEISTMTGTTVPISETVNAPVFAKRSAQTRVAIRNGQTIVIGGLMEDRLIDTIEKVPGLGDMPWIGPLFRRTIKTKSKTELLIFITPHVAALPEQLEPMAKQEKEGSKEFNKPDNKPALDEQLKGMKLGATTLPARPTTYPTVIISDPKKQPPADGDTNDQRP